MKRLCLCTTIVSTICRILTNEDFHPDSSRLCRYSLTDLCSFVESSTNKTSESSGKKQGILC